MNDADLKEQLLHLQAEICQLMELEYPGIQPPPLGQNAEMAGWAASNIMGSPRAVAAYSKAYLVSEIIIESGDIALLDPSKCDAQTDCLNRQMAAIDTILQLDPTNERNQRRVQLLRDMLAVGRERIANLPPSTTSGCLASVILFVGIVSLVAGAVAAS